MLNALCLMLVLRQALLLVSDSNRFTSLSVGFVQACLSVGVSTIHFG